MITLQGLGGPFLQEVVFLGRNLLLQDLFGLDGVRHGDCSGVYSVLCETMEYYSLDLGLDRLWRDESDGDGKVRQQKGDGTKDEVSWSRT